MLWAEVLPDAICKRIQNRYMLPYFKDNNWNAGMVAGIRAVNGYLDGSMENIGNDKSENDPLEFIIIFFVIFGGFIGIGLYANWRKTRCPHCKKHKLQRLSSKVIDRSNGTKTEEVVYKCRNCGHIVVGTKAPEVCPVCAHPQSYFEIHAENY